MRHATRLTLSTFGILAGLAGIEHGIGEVLQGNVAPDGLMILSWPDSPLFRLQAGEPAMTIVPNLLVTGILAILASLAMLAWAAWFLPRKGGGLVLVLLSIVALLVGGGFGPPLLGIIVGIAATRIDAPPARLRSLRFLGALWPWFYAAALGAWLLLSPGSLLVEHFFGLPRPDLVVSILIFSAFGSLAVTIPAAFAHDGQRLAASPPRPVAMDWRPATRDR